jgi:hypothetical protein
VKLGCLDKFITAMRASPEDGGVGLTPSCAKGLHNALAKVATEEAEKAWKRAEVLGLWQPLMDAGLRNKPDVLAKTVAAALKWFDIHDVDDVPTLVCRTACNPWTLPSPCAPFMRLPTHTSYGLPAHPLRVR